MVVISSRKSFEILCLMVPILKVLSYKLRDEQDVTRHIEADVNILILRVRKLRPKKKK